VSYRLIRKVILKNLVLKTSLYYIKYSSSILKPQILYIKIYVLLIKAVKAYCVRIETGHKDDV
jgi:hypothetical protein